MRSPYCGLQAEEEAPLWSDKGVIEELGNDEI